MNKNIFMMFLFFFFIFFAMRAAAEDEVFRNSLTPQNMSAFNTVCARLAARPVVKGTFSQEKYLSRFNRSLNSSGNFIIANEFGMVWETLQPFPSTMIMGNDFILQLRPDGQVSVLGAQGNESFVQMAAAISAVFSGNSRRLLENFEVSFLGNIAPDGSVSNWSIGLLPKDSAIASFAAKIIMSGDSVIRYIRIFEGSGDTITYTMSNHSFPAELNDHEKSFFQIQ